MSQSNDSGLNLDHLEALARAATPGPWHWVNPENDQPRKLGEWRASLRTVQEFNTRWGDTLPKFIVNADEICDENMDANANFIATANPAAVLELIALARRAALANQPAPTVPAVDALRDWKLGQWFDAQTLDEMQAFYLSRLPAIRAAAAENGYAIGLHGSERRDFDLMAMQWRDGASDKDTLARAIADAACGIRREGAYDWEQKPSGRLATSIPVCWTAYDNPDFDKPSVGHIDLSLIAHQPAQEQAEKVDGDMLPPVGAKVLIHLGRQDAWVEHTVTGYYVWPACKHQVKDGEKDAHRVFVRVKDAQGYDNARLLSEVKVIGHAAQQESVAAPQQEKTPKPAHGHRDDYYLLANGRRLGLEPISRVRNMPNWVLAMELFATGSTSARQLCRDAGVHPDSTITHRAAQLDGGQEGSDHA